MFNRLEYLKTRSNNIIKSLKLRLGNKCTHCSSTKQLQFDHINPDTKSFRISHARSVSLKRLEEEIKKCQLLCINCHKKKTKEEYSKKLKVHGTVYGYHRGCRCIFCSNAKRKSRK